MKTPAWFSTTDVFTSKSNLKYKLLSYTKGTAYAQASCSVVFLETSYIKTFMASCVRSGAIKDPMSRTVFGVGLFGDGPHKTKVNGKTSNCYNCWTNMLERCYEEKHHNFPRYGGVGVSVCRDWHNFQNFAKWYEDNYPSDGEGYQLDKDVLSGSKHGKLYSPATCKFITPQENTAHSQQGEYLLRSPDGDVVRVENMRKFCRDSNMNRRSMQNMLNGKWCHYKGWTKAEQPDSIRHNKKRDS